MRGQWISNSSARFGTFSGLRLAAASVSLPDCADATVGVGGEIEEGRQGRLIDSTIHTAEVHWYEAHGIGRRDIKIKFPLLD
jgi:hypothetical protein